MPTGAVVVDEPDAATVARLGAEISAFNFATTGIHDGRELFAAVHDEHGELVGGVYGWTWGGTCWIERLWVGESHLTTHSFQAPDLYRRHGFQIVGEITDYPAGHSYFLMRRRL